MEFKDVVVLRRTKRKFLAKKVLRKELEVLVDYARYAPMGANLQPLKYVIVDDEKMALDIFKYTKWSGYHPNEAPTVDERPPAYIAIAGDLNIKSNASFECDAGAAGAIISLAAEDMGLGSCWLGSIDIKEISKILNLKENLSLLYLIAIGYSNQEGKVVDADGDIKYYTDEDKVLTVPKRTLDEVLLK